MNEKRLVDDGLNECDEKIKSDLIQLCSLSMKTHKQESEHQHYISIVDKHKNIRLGL